MGIVYEAIHPALKKRFAIKTLHPTYASNEEARRRFLREAEAAASINHPNVVAVSDVGVEGNLPYMVMELLEGQTLDRLFAARGPLPVQESVELLLPVLSAAAAGHERGIIHRDLKPQNIFLSRGHRGEVIPKILDFGVSKVTGDDNALLTKTMAVLGTAAYMSPEQAQGARRVDFQSDQYSLGLILFECLTGRRAYPGESALEILHKAANGAVPSVRQLRPDLPPAIDAVLTRMLSVPIRSRYSSLREVGRALLAFAGERTRLNLAGEFEDRPAPEGASTGGAPEGPMEPRSQVGRDPALASETTAPSVLDVRPGGTRVLATSDDTTLTDTTLRHVAAEVSSVRDPARARRRGRAGVGAVAALVLITAGAGAVVAIRRPGGTDAGPRAARSSATNPEPRPMAETKAKAEARADVTGAGIASAPPVGEAPSALFEIRATPPEAEIVLDGKSPVRGRLSLVLPLGGSSHLLRVSAPGFVSKVVPFAATERPPSEIRLTPIDAEKTTPAATLTSSSSVSTKPQSHPKAIRAASPAGEPSRPARIVRAMPPRAAEGPKEDETPRPPEPPPPPRRGANNALMIPLN